MAIDDYRAVIIGEINYLKEANSKYEAKLQDAIFKRESYAEMKKSERLYIIQLLHHHMELNRKAIDELTNKLIEMDE